MSKSSNKKTLAKANGLKSAFLVGKDIYLTSFGKGNNAILEKHVFGDEIESINLDNPNFEAVEDKNNSKKLEIKGKHSTKTALADKPVVSNPRQDLLGAKSVLEKIYFGREFNDNIHIQICYNILDIYKILFVHVNNATFVLKNLIYNANVGRTETDINYDFIDNICTETVFNADEYDAFLRFLKSPYINYFGDLFVKNKSESDEEYANRCFRIITFIGSLRQAINHHGIRISKTERSDWMFNLESDECLSADSRKLLDTIYDKRFSKIGYDFISHSGKDVQILHSLLMKIFPDYVDSSSDSFGDIAKKYFDFIEIKTYKNIGFSIKRLRETMLEITGAEQLKKKTFDSVRSRLYRTIDFIINYYYAVVNTQELERSLNELRNTLNESDKEIIYNCKAKFVWENIFKNIINDVTNTVIKISRTGESNKHLNITSAAFDMPDYSKASKFTKLMYLLTCFLDSKETNDLLTTLSNKFSNICCLVSTAAEMNLNIKFEPEYRIFEDCEKICSELSFVRSIAIKKQKVAPNAKKRQYLDALDLLGIPNNMTKNEINEFVDEFLKIEDENGKKKKHDFRNFIAGNVINSSRFNYIMRYNSVAKTKNYIKNKELVRFVLTRIDEKQIDRYYSACHFEKNNTKEGKIDRLAEALQHIDFTVFADIDNRASFQKNPEAARKKAVYQTIVSLYLTVLYHIVKNLIYVNSRYAMAFYCYQRDLYILKQKYDKEAEETNQISKISNRKYKEKKDYLLLPVIFVSDGKLNSHFIKNIKTNYYNLTNVELVSADEKIIHPYKYNELLVKYRNNVAHLTVISRGTDYINKINKINSYFDLYHYILQNILMESVDVFDKLTPRVKACFENLITYRSYSKDLLHMLNLPFSYNISRYKSLSIGDLFDKNAVKGK